MNEKIMTKMHAFATLTEDELYNYIEKLPDRQKSLAYTIYGLTWNMIAEKLNNE